MSFEISILCRSPRLVGEACLKVDNPDRVGHSTASTTTKPLSAVPCATLKRGTGQHFELQVSITAKRTRSSTGLTGASASIMYQPEDGGCDDGNWGGVPDLAQKTSDPAAPPIHQS